MIKFACILCGERISVQEQLAGKRITCPKCNSTSVVPSESPRIKFTCRNCGQGIRVLQIHAGKEGKCPKCQSPIVVPSLRADPADGSETVIFVCSMCNETIRAPKGSKERFTECPQCGSNVETSLRGEPVESDSSIQQSADEDEYDDESDIYEEETGLDRRVIFAISGAALVVVVGLIILITVVLPSGSEPGDDSVPPPRQELAESGSQPQSPASSARPIGTFTLEPPEEGIAPEEPSGRPIAGAHARDSGLLLWLKPGQMRSVRIIKEDRVSQTMMGQQQDIISTGTTELEFEVEGVDPNGVARLRVTYLTIKEKGQGLAEQMQYDSTTPDVPTEHPFAPTYSAMIGQSFVAKVAWQGMIVGLEGVDEMFLRVAERIVQGEDEATRKRISERATEGVEERVQRSIDRLNEVYGSRQKRVEHVRDLLKKNPMIADQRIKDMVGNLVVVYPGRAVEAGDSWQAKQRLFSLGAAGLDCTYTLREKTPAVMVVDVSAQIDLEDEPVAAGEGTFGSASTTLKGSYNGTLEIDPDTGWMLRKKATMNCAGHVKMSPNAQMPQGMTLPITMSNVTTVEPIE
ncbi:MAG: DUF6263 family protein [Planctomycetota bacterium]|jgi:DNA-directed RNA polymerase subunit RPC12/RpoP